MMKEDCPVMKRWLLGLLLACLCSLPGMAQEGLPVDSANNYVMSLADDAGLLQQQIKLQEQMGKMGKTMTPEKALKRAKRLKIAAWVVPPVSIISGILMTGASMTTDEHDMIEVNDALSIPGWTLLFAWIPVTTTCAVRARKLKKKYSVETAPVYGHEFRFKNGTSLSTNVCTLSDGFTPTPSLGLGVGFNF